MAKKLTLEQFTENFFNKWPERRGQYSFAGSKYLGKDKKMTIYCIKHEKYFESTPSTLLHTGGAGCELCRLEKKEKSLENTLRKNSVKLLKFVESVGYTYDTSTYEGEGKPVTFINIKDSKDVLTGTPTWFKERYYRLNNIERKSFETILKESIKEHYPNIDTSRIVYKLYTDPVELVCIKHPEESFWMTPDTIKRKISQGVDLCIKCVKEAEARERTAHLIAKYNLEHPNHHYDFSKSIVTSVNDDFICHCNKHNIDFVIGAERFFNGDGICPECAKERRKEKNRLKEEKRFFDYMKKEHPDIDISDARYETSTTPLLLHCNIHPNEDIWLSPWDVRFGIPRIERGICPICSEIERNNKLKDYWIKKAEVAQNYRYDYSNIKYNGWSAPVEGIVCKGCGKTYSQTASSHLLGYCCCHECYSLDDSIMETYVIRWLVDNNIDYSQEVYIQNSELSFNNKNKSGIRIDFVIEQGNKIYWIETDGPQHNKFVSRYHPNGFSDYERQVIRDECERLHCISNNIELLRFSYLYNSYPKFSDALSRIILYGEEASEVLMPYPDIQDYETIVSNFVFNK